MASVQSIREHTQLISDEEMRKICVRIIDEVAQRADGDNQGFWTFQTLAKWVDRDPADRTLHQCIQWLVGQRDAQLLDMHFKFYDPNNPEDIGEVIEDEEVKEAFSSGYLVHPESGEELFNFEDALVPFFVPSEGLAKT